MLHVHLKREEVMYWYVVEHIYSWAKERGEIPQHPPSVAWHGIATWRVRVALGGS